MKVYRITQFMAIALMSVSSVSFAGGDPVEGEAKSAACQACHGADGLGTDPSYPVLAGQYEDYLVHALKSYKTGDRTNAIMAGLVTTLTEEDIEDLAAYYAGLPNALHTLPDR